MSGIQGLYDRGATDYFHGRTSILKRFEDLLAKSGETSGGSTFLVQGPPGIGKTALLAECWMKAAEAGWHVAEIDPDDLWDADKLQETLGLPPEKRTVSHTVEGGGTLDLNLVKGGAKRRKTYVVNTSRATPLELIKKAGEPLLLILDEAQHLGEDGGPPEEHRKPVRTLLKKIHNGGVGKSVILLAGGLGMTFESFAALGISRPLLGSRFNMEPLKREEERAVVEDWLTKEGEAQGDPTAWIDAITQETYGWAQHIISYTLPAVSYLKNHGNKMTDMGLASVMEEGRANRMEYYKHRLSPFTAKECRSFARILLASSGEGGIEQEVAVDQLDKEYGAGEGAELFFQAVRRGVFHMEETTKLYSAPIPSLREYIIRNFPPKEQSPNMGLEK